MNEHGLLLLQDKRILSVAGIFTGESLSRSWWSHPRSHEIFRFLQQLDDEGDVLTCRLIAGKVTFVHRTLWPAFFAVALSDAPWQRTTSSDPRVLQERLLVAAEEVHTESGRHELKLRTWDSWAKKRQFSLRDLPNDGEAQLEAAAVGIGAKVSMLPWRRYLRFADADVPR